MQKLIITIVENGKSLNFEITRDEKGATADEKLACDRIHNLVWNHLAAAKIDELIIRAARGEDVDFMRGLQEAGYE